MYYIVGLGNPGKEYERTRHNVGFLVVEEFVKEAGLPSFHQSSASAGMVSEGTLAGQEVTVLLPQTFMNASGSAVRKLVEKDQADKLVVVYDDVDIPLGEIKISFGRGDGGHNGVKSIIEALKSRDFTRIRVGIARTSMWTGKPVRPKGKALSSYMLGNFSSKEEKQLTSVKKIIQEAIGVFVAEGKEKAMNRFN